MASKVMVHRVKLSGEGIHEVPLEASEHGLVIEVNASTAYLYITNRDFSEIFDALHLYDRGTADELQNGESAFVVWSSDAERAGVYYRGRFQAAVDFERHEARCRSGFPTLPNTPWLRSGHEWDDELVRGLEP